MIGSADGVFMREISSLARAVGAKVFDALDHGYRCKRKTGLRLRHRENTYD
jgi:hypothetical protein